MRARLRDEGGQALLLALAFLLFFGLVIAAILGFAEASVMKTTNLREQRSAAYAADGATDAAIQFARRYRAVGALGSSPCMWVDPFTVTVNGVTASVTCEQLGDTDATDPEPDLDRTVRFTASVDGIPRVQAVVFFRDSTAGSGLPETVVLSWTYLRS